MLDKSRPYGTIHGQHRAKYIQDGKEYDALGNPLETEQEGPYEPSPPDYHALHWTKLKALVEAQGGSWVDKASAIEFLSQ